MSTNGHQPGADVWGAAQRRRVARRHGTPIATSVPPSRAAAPPATAPTRAPPPANPIAADDDPSSLPIFGGAWASDEPGRAGPAPSSPCARSSPATPSTSRTSTTPDPDQTRDAVLDWELVAQYRAEISSRLTARLDKEGGRITDEDREQLGIEVIEELIRAEAENLVSAGRRPGHRTRRRLSRRPSRPPCSAWAGSSRWSMKTDVENIIIIARGPTARCGWRRPTAPWSRPRPSPTPRTSCASSSPTSAPDRTVPSPKPGPACTCGCRAAPAWQPPRGSPPTPRSSSAATACARSPWTRWSTTARPADPCWPTSSPPASGPARASSSPGSRAAARPPGSERCARASRPGR